MQAACPGAWESVTQLAAGLVRTTSHHFDGAVSFLEEIADEIVGVPEASAGAEPVGRLAGVGVGEEPVEIDVDDDDDGSEGATAAAAGASISTVLAPLSRSTSSTLLDGRATARQR